MPRFLHHPRPMLGAAVSGRCGASISHRRRRKRRGHPRPPKPLVEIPAAEETAGRALGWHRRRGAGARHRRAAVAAAAPQADGSRVRRRSRSPRWRNLKQSREAITAEAFANRAAQTVRQYIADRFGFAAPRRTTEEFLRDLATRGSAAHRRERSPAGVSEILRSREIRGLAAWMPPNAANSSRPRAVSSPPPRQHRPTTPSPATTP